MIVRHLRIVVIIDSGGLVIIKDPRGAQSPSARVGYQSDYQRFQLRHQETRICHAPPSKQLVNQILFSYFRTFEFWIIALITHSITSDKIETLLILSRYSDFIKREW